MGNLSGAVAKTMNSVFADIETTTNETKKRITTIKANLGKIANISLDEIETNENIRKSIDTQSDNFQRLVESIKKYGVLENIVVAVQINKKETDYKLICIAGHRRILAAKAAKNITKVPCLLNSYSNNGDNIGAALAENLNREDLHCLDIAGGYHELVNAGWSEDDLAKHYCRDVRTIRHYLKMADWADEIKDTIRKNPSVLSTRVVMRQLAYKKYSSPSDLKLALRRILSPKAKLDAKKTKAVAKAASVDVKTNAKHGVDKKAIKTSLNDYLAKQKLLSGVIKDEIKKAFIELKLI